MPTQKTVSLLCCALAFVVFPVAAQPPQAKTGKLSGKLHDQRRMAASNVTIILLDATGTTRDMTVTDSAGAFEFARLSAGEYGLETSSTVYGAVPKQSITIKNQAVKVNLIIPDAGPSPVDERSTARIHVEEHAQTAKLVRSVKAIYPESAKRHLSQGAVQLQTFIGGNGSVMAARVINTDIDPDLAKAAIDAVKQFRYQPTVIDGNPVEVISQLTVFFNASR